jgi:hypothetical protein
LPALPQQPFLLHFVCNNGAAAVFAFLLFLPPAAQNRESPKREAFKKSTANICWQWGMYAKEIKFVGLEAKPVLCPYRACAGHPLYGWS